MVSCDSRLVEASINATVSREKRPHLPLLQSRSAFRRHAIKTINIPRRTIMSHGRLESNLPVCITHQQGVNVACRILFSDLSYCDSVTTSHERRVGISSHPPFHQRALSYIAESSLFQLWYRKESAPTIWRSFPSMQAQISPASLTSRREC